MIELYVLTAALVFAGGFVKGFNGFGYALAGTALLATLIEPVTAITLMIIPVMASNIYLASELDRDVFKPCIDRFGVFILAAMLGTVAGMLFIDAVNQSLLRFGIGSLTLLFVASKLSAVSDYFRFLQRKCFVDTREMKAGFGFLSGVLFGSSNVAVQIVAYLETVSDDRKTFVGVLAMIMLGVSMVRILMSGALGLYGDGQLLLVSVVAVIPGMAGVYAGQKLSNQVSKQYRDLAVYMMLLVIALRLLTKSYQGI